jgi:peptidoglycan/LPS O-acetylase OafA/YrhL
LPRTSAASEAGDGPLDRRLAAVTDGGARRPDLDGLRGLAILLVLVEHTAISDTYLLPFTPAIMGVTTFFVLSGYLITGLLLLEDPIDLRNFYLRRVIRLGPALLVMLALVALVGVAHGTAWMTGVATALLYVTNWAHAMDVDLGLAQHTWTLAIEEQFYLLWPLALLAVRRRWLLAVAVALALAGSAMYATRTGPWFYSTLTNGAGLMAGCAAAMLGRRLPPTAGLVGVALIGSAAVLWSQPLAIAGAILVVTSPIRALLPLAPVGRRAYSLYLWSWPLVALLGGPIALPLTILAAELSYRFVERPVLARFHDRLRSRSSVQARLTATATG